MAWADKLLLLKRMHPQMKVKVESRIGLLTRIVSQPATAYAVGRCRLAYSARLITQAGRRLSQELSSCARCLSFRRARIFDSLKSDALGVSTPLGVLNMRLPVATSILDLGLDRAAEIVAEGDDLRLVEALRGGTEEAYEELLARFQQPVYTLALRLLEDQSEAGDVVQEVFLKVFRNIGSFRAQSTLKTWIYRITVNEAHNARRWRFRHKRREVELDPAAEDGRSFEDVVADRAQSPFEAVFDRERRALLDVALERL